MSKHGVNDVTKFPGGICHFCGEKAKQHYFSGSYEQYDKCDCELRKAWRKSANETYDLLQVAKRNYEAFILDRKIKDISDQLKDAQVQRKRLNR